MTQAVSLQTKLIKTSMLSSIVAGVFALILLVSLSIYHNMKVQDEIMDEVADMLLISDLSATSGFQLDELSDEFDIQYRLMNGEVMLTQSPEFDLQQGHDNLLAKGEDNGYAFIWAENKLLRSYRAIDQDSQLSVYVVQPLSVRFKDLLQSFISYLLVLLSLWLLQWLILHFSVKKQFKSIQLLSTEIAEKNANDLSLIQQQPAFKELEPMVNQLNQMLARLDQALIAEQRFTADASHELRSPLSAIQMRLQLLQRKYVEVPEIHQQLNSIQNDVNRGTLVLENLLLLARLDPADASELPKTWISLEQMTQHVLNSLDPFIDEKQVQIHIQSEDVQVYVNEELLFICIRNLVDNAIRYTPVQGNIYIQIGPLNNSNSFEIQNDGEGIPQDILDRLGERFYRALGTKTQGSGLGLSICKKVIDLHHGQIQFAASKYGGLSVCVYLR
ncbi:sensor histidine kinase [Acinetobacter guillouiae]|uniref:sensor histidine kinase n=1 Tax=Acinetobacter guillouiae TaxID=106649 RepID=UPI0004EF64C6|nr:HAMP domain-containing sensor histidine kinase [Acinetobacter guillouiae]BAP36275.1 putative two-component histidine kinase [Acinetobacter guillouiae]